MTDDQGLLKRNPGMTHQEFSDHWYYKHGPIVIPYFLHGGITYYAQIHGPLSTIDPGLDALEWDGAVHMPSEADLAVFRKGDTEPQWKRDYYREVILVDERRFLASEALNHIKRVGPQTVSGGVKVVIRDGKSLVDVPDSIWKVWRTYEARGQKQQDGGEIA